MELGPKRMRFNDAHDHDSRMRTKPCTKFFSTAGCPYGDNCHFMHYVPGTSMGSPSTSNLVTPSYYPEPTIPPGPPPTMVKPPFQDAVTSGYKTRLCNKYDTPEGCRFGKNCNFAHGQEDLRGNTTRPMVAPPGFKQVPSASTTTTSRITVKAAVVGAIIGKAGSNVKEISQITGAKLSVRDHDSDPTLRNVEVVGSLEQIQVASEMVRRILQQLPTQGLPSISKPNFKTKMCQKFTFGTCTFGDRCHFAHSQDELR